MQCTTYRFHCYSKAKLGQSLARLTKTVSLDMGGSKVPGMDVTSND